MKGLFDNLVDDMVLDLYIVYDFKDGEGDRADDSDGEDGVGDALYEVEG